jgi:LemA protein
MILLSVIIILAVLILWSVFIYNTLIKQNDQTQEAWSCIDVQLKRRHDLIPDLIETVKGYATHESKVFQQVTDLKSKIGETQSISEKGELNNALSSGLAQLIAVAEQYPDLKLNENFIQLQQQLSIIEAQIQTTRKYYNDTTRDYNTSLQSVPQVFIANAFQFEPFEYFEIEQNETLQVDLKNK